MTIDLKAIREREIGATKGPWYGTDEAAETGRLCPVDHDDGDDEPCTVSRSKDSTGWSTDGGYPQYGICRHDADFIAHARADIPALLALVDELAEALLTVETYSDEECELNCCRHKNSWANYKSGRVEHDFGCGLSAALTAAGYPDAASRAAARERLKR